MPEPYSTFEVLGAIEAEGYQATTAKQRRIFQEMGLSAERVREEMHLFEDYFGAYKKKGRR